jgi:hypothetical protein
VESKGKVLKMEEGAGSHRGGATPVGWRVQMATMELEAATRFRWMTPADESPWSTEELRSGVGAHREWDSASAAAPISDAGWRSGG